MIMREENLHVDGKWETMNFLGVALASSSTNGGIKQNEIVFLDQAV